MELSQWCDERDVTAAISLAPDWCWNGKLFLSSKTNKEVSNRSSGICSAAQALFEREPVTSSYIWWKHNGVPWLMPRPRDAPLEDRGINQYLHRLHLVPREDEDGVASVRRPSAVHASELQGPAAHWSAKSLAAGQVR